MRRRGSLRTSTASCDPSADRTATNDFQVFELIRIVDRFAVEFDDLPRLIAERDDYRILVMSGTLLAGFSVIGQLAADGAVELVQLDLDTELDW